MPLLEIGIHAGIGAAVRADLQRCGRDSRRVDSARQRWPAHRGARSARTERIGVPGRANGCISDVQRGCGGSIAGNIDLGRTRRIQIRCKLRQGRR